MLRLTGSQMEQLRDAILDAFDRDALEELLLFRLDKQLDQIVSPQVNLRNAARAVVAAADREGWLAGLLSAMKAERPDLVSLQELVTTLESQPESRSPGPADRPRRVMPTVFISYSHKDAVWKERLVTHLSVLADEGLFTVWDDTRIGAGQEWEREIEEAMSSAAVTVLMVSPDFLASKFVKTREIPRLLQRRELEGLRVIPVIVRPCPWSRIPWLSAMQARPKDARPLSGGTENQIDADLAAIAEEIADILQAFETADLATDAPEVPSSSGTAPRLAQAPVAPKEATEPPVRSEPTPVEVTPNERARVVENPLALSAPPDTLIITEPTRIELVRVVHDKPLLMGTPPGQVKSMLARFDWATEFQEKGWFRAEQPGSRVAVAPFAIGRYPITNAQYAVFVSATGHVAPEHWDWGMFPPGEEEHPVVNVSWHDAMEFTEWLSGATGLAFRLPTETEWEKAARGEDGRRWPWGHEWEPDRANCRQKGPGRTTPVGAYSPQGDSPFGCSDMAGNVFEWCLTKWRDDYASEPDNGRDGDDKRVLRGGCFASTAGQLRCAYRYGLNSEVRNDLDGFRVAISLPLPDLVITNPLRMALVRVQAGKFLMGDEKYDIDLADFYIGKYPVTNAQYAAFAKATGLKAAPTGKDDHPVVNVSWHDAIAFTEWLSKQTGKSFRLPTEAEWEKAARGMDGRIYPWVGDWDPKKANTREGGPGRITSVGQYSPDGDSPYGCADMAGNVWEWTSSLDKPYPYLPNDGREDLRSTDARVVRGGSWDHFQRYARCASRDWNGPDNFDYYIGFRVSLSLSS